MLSTYNFTIEITTPSYPHKRDLFFFFQYEYIPKCWQVTPS